MQRCPQGVVARVCQPSPTARGMATWGKKVSKIALDAQPGGNDEVDHPKADVFVAVNAQLIKNNGQIQ